MSDPVFSPKGDPNNQGIAFDPILFARNIYQAVDANRSVMASQPFNIVDTPPKEGASNRMSEPRLNTFFRMLGLPAVRDETFLNPREGVQSAFASLVADPKLRAKTLSADSTLNYFASGVTTGDFALKVALRNQFFARTVTAEAVNTMLSKPLSISESIDQTKNRRAPLFPLVVDASVPVFPLEKRVAPLFYDGDYILLGGRSRLKRPFLQHVIYMRTKSYSTANPKLQLDLIANITSAIGDNVILPTDLAQFTFFQLNIITRFIAALEQSAYEYGRVLSRVAKIQSRISYDHLPVDNPEARSGSGDSNTDATFSDPDLDARIRQIDTLIQAEELFLLTLPTEDLNRSDRIRRLEDQISIQNFSPDAFISEFTSLLTCERDYFKSYKDDLVSQRSRAVQQIEQARRDLSYYTGEFYGLSIFDIIAVLYAFFTVDLSSLVGLLNDGAQRRILQDPFYSTNIQATSSPQFDTGVLRLDVLGAPPLNLAMTALEKKVREGFKIATAFLSRSSTSVHYKDQPEDLAEPQ